jgi:hypothetical protein
LSFKYCPIFPNFESKETEMAKKNVVRIDLEFPDSWEQLTAEQIEAVHRLKHESYKQALRSDDPEKTVNQFKLRVFLLLAGLKVRKRAIPKEDGTFIYLLRRKGWKHIFEEIPMESWQIAQWIKALLPFLDEPNGLLSCPYTTFKVHGTTYKAPDPQLTSVTFEQYNHAQQFLIAYWDTFRLIEEMKNNGSSVKAIKHQYKELEQYKAQFLATLFTPAVHQTLQTDESGTYRVNRIAYPYHSSQSETHWKHFSGKRWRWTFEVMVQYLQSCLEEYRSKFPDLFTSHSGADGKDFIVLEADKMNAIKKYGNFGSYQSIYDSNAFFIFGQLSNMCQEAKAIEEMNRKIKSKK